MRLLIERESPIRPERECRGGRSHKTRLRSRFAPVNAPCTKPKSSEPINVAGIAAQLRTTKGPLTRALCRYTARAINSFPSPFLPR